MVGSVAVGATCGPEGVRLGLSRAVLVAAGEKVLAGEQPRRAGLYGFRNSFASGGCAFLEAGTFGIESFGFAYCPDGDGRRPNTFD